MHSEKEGWREIKRKRIAAKSVRAPTRLVKPTRPSQSSSCFIPQMIFSFFPVWFPSETLPLFWECLFCSHAWLITQLRFKLKPSDTVRSTDFPPLLPSPCCQFFDIWSLGQGNKLLSTIILFLIPKKKYQDFGEELILDVRLNTVPEDKFIVYQAKVEIFMSFYSLVFDFVVVLHAKDFC